MAQTRQLIPRMTPEECLEAEKSAEFRSEFVDDALYAMSGVSEARVDRGEKFHAYTSLPSVGEYIFVSQDAVVVDVFRRRNGWKQQDYAKYDEIELASIGHNLPSPEIYRDIPF